MPTDPLQVSALNALAPFLALAPSATSPRAAADLVSQAIASPGTYVFAELLATPNVNALTTAEGQFQRWYHALEIFCWGTWGEYESKLQSSPDSLPPLSDKQKHKLRLLTLLTLSHSPSSLSYAHLTSSLGLQSTSELEPLLIESLSSSLLTGRLNPAAQRLDVKSVAPLRDVAPGSVPGLVSVLEKWEERCTSVLREVENRMASVREGAKERGKRQEEWETMLDGRIGVPRESPGGAGGRGGGPGGKGRGGKGGGGKDDLDAKGGKRDRSDDVGGDAKRGGRFGVAGRRAAGLTGH